MTTVDDPGMLAEAMPFARSCGVEIHHATPEQVSGTLEWRPERCTSGGALHGGAIMTLADSVGAACAFLNLPAGAGTATISSTTSFLRAVRDGVVTAVSRPLHAGRSVIAVRTEVFDSHDHLVAHIVQHQTVRRPHSEHTEKEQP